MRQVPFLCLAAPIFAACAVAPPAPAPVADTIFRGGTILTMDDAGRRAEALAVGGRRILAVGTADEVLRLTGPDTVIVELGGRTIVPGFVAAHGALPPSADDGAIARASADMAARGWTTIQDGAATPQQVERITGVANAMRLRVDAVVFPLWEGVDALGDELEDMDCIGTMRIGGLALAASAPVPPAELKARVARCFANRWHVHATVRSGADADALIEAVRAARVAPGGAAPPRVVAIVHTGGVSERQLSAMAELGIVPSFCTTGPSAPADLAPRAAAIPGLRFTLHACAASAPADPLAVLAVAVGSGLDAERALRAITADAAWQLRMDGRKGSLEVGKLADLVMLSDDPTAVAPGALQSVRVLRTIKSGVPVSAAGD